jgi:hypothetical protein
LSGRSKNENKEENKMTELQEIKLINQTAKLLISKLKTLAPQTTPKLEYKAWIGEQQAEISFCKGFWSIIIDHSGFNIVLGDIEEHEAHYNFDETDRLVEMILTRIP